MLTLNKKEAREIVKGLSSPSKMPCHGYSLPAADCKVGAELRKVEGSVCHGCYAHKGFYGFSNVQAALQRRSIAILDPRWTEAMTVLIEGMPYFRWHDSGDIQDVAHLNRIFDVCDATPKTKHWLPTREYKMVEDTLKVRKRPKNLALRLSAHMIDAKGPRVLAKKLGVQISEVKTTNWSCPASEQGNSCGDCRKCWKPSIMNISYHKH